MANKGVITVKSGKVNRGNNYVDARKKDTKKSSSSSSSRSSSKIKSSVTVRSGSADVVVKSIDGQPVTGTVDSSGNMVYTASAPPVNVVRSPVPPLTSTNTPPAANAANSTPVAVASPPSAPQATTISPSPSPAPTTTPTSAPIVPLGNAATIITAVKLKNNVENLNVPAKPIAGTTPRSDTKDKALQAVLSKSDMPKLVSVVKDEKINKDSLAYMTEKLEQSSMKPGTKNKELARVKAAGAGFVQGFSNALNPFVAIPGVWQGIQDPNAALTSIQSKAATSPYSFGGEAVGAFAAPTVLGKFAGTIKSGVVSVGSKKVPLETVTTGEGMPLSPSTQATIRSFKQGSKGAPAGTIIGVHASPNPLTSTVAGYSSKPGLEDAGVYLFPKGRAGTNFLRTNKNYAGEVSLNPYGYIKELTGQPTITEFQATGISTIPKNVVKVPGFQAVDDFYTSQSGSGKIFITKRSQIGQGDVPRSQFVAPYDVDKGNLKVKAGDVRRPAGTSEAETIVPINQKFDFYTSGSKLSSVKGYDSYVTFEGKNIPIQTAKLVTESPSSLPANVPSSSLNVIPRGYNNYKYVSSINKAAPNTAFSAGLFSGTTGLISGGRPVAGGFSGGVVGSAAVGTSNVINAIQDKVFGSYKQTSVKGSATASVPPKSTPSFVSSYSVKPVIIPPPYVVDYPGVRKSGGGGGSSAGGGSSGGGSNPYVPPSDSGGGSSGGGSPIGGSGGSGSGGSRPSYRSYGSSASGVSFPSRPPQYPKGDFDLFGGNGFSSSGGWGNKQPTAYNPSLYAAVFDIEGEQPTDLYTLGGLGIRPKIRRGKKRGVLFN